QPLGGPPRTARHLLRRHAAAVRRRGRAAGQPEADHCRRAHRRAGPGGARALPQPAERDRRGQRGGAVDAHRRGRRGAVHAHGDHRPRPDPARGGAAARDRRAARADLAPHGDAGGAGGGRAGAAGDLHQAARGAHGRARLRRVVAGRGVRAGRAGPEGRVLQRHGGAPRAARRRGGSGSGSRNGGGGGKGGGGGAVRFREVFRYELEYRLRSASTWVYAAVLFGLAFAFGLTASPFDAAVHANAPAHVAFAALIVSLPGLAVTAALFGDAAVRDVQAGMDALLFTSPLRKAEYLGGRFLAVLAVNAALL